MAKHHSLLLIARGSATITGCLALAVSSFAQTSGYTTRLLADTNGPYVLFGEPAINRAGDVAVLAHTASGATSIIRLNASGVQTMVSEQGDIASLATGGNDHLMLNDTGFVAYSAELTTGEQAIRITDGIATFELARNTLLPQPSNTTWSGSPVLVFSDVALNDHNQVAFYATDPNNGMTVAFRAAVSGIREVARSSSDMSSDYVWLRRIAINDAGEVLVQARFWPSVATGSPFGCDSGVGGLTAMVRFAQNGFRAVLAGDDSTLTSATLSQPQSPLMTDSGDVVYRGGCSNDNARSIARGNGANALPLVAYDTSPSNLITWNQVDGFSIDSQGELFFVARKANGPGVLAHGAANPADVVLTTDSIVDNQVVAGLQLGRDGVNDLGQVACTANFSDRQGIVLATALPPAPNVYCTAGTSASGCVPQIASAGVPSSTGDGSFVVSVSGLPAQVSTLFFYGVSGAQISPWGNSSALLCVRSPLQRIAPILSSGGGATPACNGTASVDWNAFIANHPSALGAPFEYLDEVWVQAYYRDASSPTGPSHAKGTKLSNALHFSVGL